MTTVLLVDDDRRAVSDYRAALKKEGLKVIYKPSIRSAKEHLDKVGPPEFIVLDVMMRSGPLYGREETVDGTETGLLFATDLMARWPEAQVLILTSRDPTRLPLRRYDKIDEDSVLSKAWTTPEGLARHLTQVRDGGQE